MNNIRDNLEQILYELKFHKWGGKDGDTFLEKYSKDSYNMDDVLDELETYINKVREEDWLTIHRAIIDTIFSVNERCSKDDIGIEGYGYNKAINKTISKLNKLLDLSEQYLQSIKEQDKK